MRPFLASCLLLAIAVPCQAQPKPNTLTPKEIADGWILLFDGETTFGWKFNGGFDASDGALLLTGLGKAEAFHAIAWNNFELQFEYRLEENKGGAFLTVEDRSACVLQPEKGNWYQAGVYHDFDPESEQYVFQFWVEFRDPASTPMSHKRAASAANR